MRSAVAMVAAIALASPAFAAECAGVEAVEEPEDLELATVRTGKTFFHDDEMKPTKAYVLKGDELLVEAGSGNWRCATYVGRKGDYTSGFLKSNDLALRPLETPPLKDWLGYWTTGPWANLTLSKGTKPGWLAVEGEAYWAMSEEAAKSGGLNEGSISGEGPLENGAAAFTQTYDDKGNFVYVPYAQANPDSYDCAILVRMLGPHYLMAYDNGNCGGHNVRFTGVYAKGKVKSIGE